MLATSILFKVQSRTPLSNKRPQKVTERGDSTRAREWRIWLTRRGMEDAAGAKQGPARPGRGDGSIEDQMNLLR